MRNFVRLAFVEADDCTIQHMLTYDVSYAFEVHANCIDYTVAKTPFASLPPTDPIVETLA